MIIEVIGSKAFFKNIEIANTLMVELWALRDGHEVEYMDAKSVLDLLQIGSNLEYNSHPYNYKLCNAIVLGFSYSNLSLFSLSMHMSTLWRKGNHGIDLLENVRKIGNSCKQTQFAPTICLSFSYNEFLRRKH